MIDNFFLASEEENLNIFTLNRSSKKCFQINDVSHIYLPLSQSFNPELSYEDFKYLKTKLYGKTSIKKVISYWKNSTLKEEFYFVLGAKKILYWLHKTTKNEILPLLKLV